MNVYAVIQSGGKQYRITPGDVVRVERLDAGPGETVELNTVCLLVTGQETHVGRPLVEGARVRAQVLEEGRGGKVLVFKSRRRKGYRKTAGHRQYFTALRVSEILFNGVVFRAQEEGPKQALKKNSEAAAPVRTKKHDGAERSKEKTKPDRGSTSAIIKDKGVSEKAAPLLPAEKPRAGSELPAAPAPVERASSGSADSAAAEQKIAGTGEKQKAEPSGAAAIPERENASALPSREEDSTPPSVRSETPDKPTEKPTEKPAESSHRWRSLVAVVAALLLALILLLWGKSQFTAPQSQSTSAPVPEQARPVDKVNKASLPAPEKAPVPEKAMEDTAPVDMPSAPAQPPD